MNDVTPATYFQWIVRQYGGAVDKKRQMLTFPLWIQQDSVISLDLSIHELRSMEDLQTLHQKLEALEAGTDPRNR